jgi:transcriptional regulator with XRE-family HTH domain
MGIGNKIKVLREIKQLTQIQVAESIGISQGSYSRLEIGETDVTYSKLQKISEQFDMKPEEIIAFDERIVFNVMNNKIANGLQINNQLLTADEKNILKVQLELLKIENTHLKFIIENLLKK